MNLFDCMFPPLKISKPIRLIELFAGIGAQAKALENLGVPFEHYRICEFDKYAVASYNAIHGTSFETSDITKIHASDLAVVDTACCLTHRAGEGLWFKELDCNTYADS